MSTTSLHRAAFFGLAAITLGALAPQLARAQSYACADSFGANCNTPLFDAYSRNNVVNVGQTTSTLLVTPGACGASDLIVDVDLTLDVLHPYVGDLEVSLTHPSGTSTQVLYRPGFGVIDGSCPGDDFTITLDDQDGLAIGAGRCARTIPAIDGFVMPFNPLSIFDGRPRNGTWTLTIRDHVQGEQGILRGWTLHLPCVPDLPDVNLDATDNLVAERGDDETATITFTRGGPTTEALTVRYVVTGTASLNDFNELPGTLEIPAGAASAELEITAVDDDQVELAETVIVSLLAGAGYEIGPRSSATVTILEESLGSGEGGAGGEGGGGAGEGGEGGGGAGEGGEGGGGAGEGGEGGGDPDAGADGSAEPSGDDDGCGCRIAGAARGPSPLALGFALILAAALARRRMR